MITEDGNWIMEGKSSEDESRIKSSNELSEYIKKVGFLPLFKSEIAGFSVEELTDSKAWFGGDSETDPWTWREVIAKEGEIAYAKLFRNKAGFISEEWYPIFASYRRDGYDFDSRYEDGLASQREKKIMDVLLECPSLPSNEIKSIAGFHKGGEKGFDSTMTSLQMKTYITVREFRRKINKKGEEYGWPVAIFSTSESLYTEEYVTSCYSKSKEQLEELIVNQVLKLVPNVNRKDIIKFIR
ncbi:AlkZ-related protein [Anaeromicropila herbilytica]|uniref:Uncharacterized protein n=1 Tax=Anaeromicropila herbilytica TaxID=2785025 RepID=A0A7R7EN03_9FIRM|nr:hypothetical protein [Anaeromicropila herbilytica]BCN31767.1 hypothetical protein bsdtb5_30620 [Anaeromicropila herbilytica]